MSVPEDILLRIDEANRLAESRAFPEAKALYQQCEERLGATRCFLLSANWGLLELETGNNAAAVSLLRKALDEDETWAQGHYNIANAYDNLGDEATAITHYTAALRLDPTDVDCLNNLALVCLKTGKLQDAQKHCASALRLSKSNPAILLAMGQIYAKMGNVKRAIYFLQKAHKLAPSTTSLLSLADVYIQLKDNGAAISFMEEALRMQEELDLDTSISLFAMMVVDRQIHRAVALLRRTQAVYTSKYPEDLVGAKLFAMLEEIHMAGENDTQVVAAPVDSGADFSQMYHSQQTLSLACEAFLLHTAVDSPDVLAHKVKIAEALQRAGHESIAPDTHIVSNAAEVHALLNESEESTMWYLKDPAVQRGQGISLIDRSASLEELSKKMVSARRYCLQKAVRPLLLHGRKFGIRIHVFVVKPQHLEELRVFVSSDGILTLCGAKYDGQSRDLLTHITCTSVQRAEPGYVRDNVKGPASHMWPGFDQARKDIQSVVVRTVEAVANELVSSPDHELSPSLRCQLFGYDFLIDAENRPVFIEANVVPQFQHAKTFTDKELVKRLINGFPSLLLESVDRQSKENPLWDHVASIQLAATSSYR